MKEIIKANTVDRYLRPIRLQIAEFVQPGSTVVEFGCGNGDLLFKLANKIKDGVGIDNSQESIAYATGRAEKERLMHLEFGHIDLLKDSFPYEEKDYSIASLLLHVLPWEKAVELTGRMVFSSKTSIVCGFSKPENLWQALLLWFDQRFTAHYQHFQKYKENGFTEGILGSIQNIKYRRVETFDPVIKIYLISR